MGAPRVSQRADSVAAFEVMDVVAAARERDRRSVSPATCHLEVGQPSAATPQAALDSARNAIDRPLGYTDALGTTELRSRISEFYAERHGIDVPEARIAVTSGASAGCVLTTLCLCDIGDRIVVFEPGYPCYGNIAESLGVEVTTIHVGADTGYLPTRGMLDRAIAEHSEISAVVVASPSNPTGTVLSAADLESMHDWCSAHSATLVTDEIYHGTATTTLPTAAAFEDSVVVQSFSKYFCMTGWRLGWLVLPEELVRPLERLSQNLYLSPHALSQAAALGAFDALAELDNHAGTYRRNREMLTATLREAGVTDIAPAQGAFYVWADLGEWGDATWLCRTLLEETGVAATPGGDFDRRSGRRFVRFSVAGTTAEIDEAAKRLAAWLGSARPRQAV